MAFGHEQHYSGASVCRAHSKVSAATQVPSAFLISKKMPSPRSPQPLLSLGQTQPAAQDPPSRWPQPPANHSHGSSPTGQLGIGLKASLSFWSGGLCFKHAACHQWEPLPSVKRTPQLASPRGAMWPSPCSPSAWHPRLHADLPPTQVMLPGPASPPRCPHHLPTSGIQRAQLTCTHLVPLLVGFKAPPRLGQSRHFGWTPRAHVRHSQLPVGTLRIP